MKLRLLTLACSGTVLLSGPLQAASPVEQFGFLGWQVDRATGTLLGTLGITNPATATAPLSPPFQLGLQSSTNFFYAHPSGTLPDGLAYVDLSAAVNAQISGGALQPRQIVFLTNVVEVFSRTRNPPVDSMFELWAGQPTGVTTQIEVDGTAGSNSLVRIEDTAATVTVSPIVLSMRRLNNTQYELRFNTLRGLFYKLQSTPDLSQPFTDEPGGFVQARDTTILRTVSVAGPSRFYRAMGALAP